jgi:hypothetical protein
VASGFLRQTGPSPANNYLLCLPCLQKQENNFFLKSKFKESELFSDVW